MPDATDFRTDFLRFALEAGVLRFGSFQTKAGRTSPYFFNAGLFHGGGAMNRLGGYYADAIQASGIPWDLLFGPAYKGIPLVVATAMRLADRLHREVPFAFNRKEVKDHGEGGRLIGAPVGGRVLLIDDVISAGTSVRESIQWIEEAGGQPAGVVIALDRQERGVDAASAVREVAQRYGLPVVAIAQVADLVRMLVADPDQADNLRAIQGYLDQYGAE